MIRTSLSRCWAKNKRKMIRSSLGCCWQPSNGWSTTRFVSCRGTNDHPHKSQPLLVKRPTKDDPFWLLLGNQAKDDLRHDSAPGGNATMICSSPALAGQPMDDDLLKCQPLLGNPGRMIRSNSGCCRATNTYTLKSHPLLGNKNVFAQVPAPAGQPINQQPKRMRSGSVPCWAAVVRTGMTVSLMVGASVAMSVSGNVNVLRHVLVSVLLRLTGVWGWVRVEAFVGLSPLCVCVSMKLFSFHSFCGGSC